VATKHPETKPEAGSGLRAGLVGGLVAAVAALLFCACNSQNAVTDRLEVGSGGYATIGAAVQAASPGDTILIHAGTYREQVVFDKQLTIQPYGDGEVVIDGECQRDYGFFITNSSPSSNPVGVVLRDMTVQNTRSASVMFAFDRSDSPRPEQGTVDGMTLRNFDCANMNDQNQYHGGVAVYYGGSGFRITNNTIVGPTGFHSWADGIWLKSSDSIRSGGGHYIAGNAISNVWDGIGGEDEHSAHGTFDGNTIVENNTITRCYDDGINVEGGMANVIVRDNDISGCGVGIALAAPVTGPLYIENNYIHDLIYGDYENLFCFKVGNGSSATAYITGNTCDIDSPAEVSTGGGDGISQTNNGLYHLVVKNNIFHVSRYIYQFSYDNPLSYGPGSDFDYNCMWTVDPERFVKWGDQQATLPLLQQYGIDVHSQQALDCGVLPTPTPTPSPTASPTRTPTPSPSLTPPPRAIPTTATSNPPPAGETGADQPPDGPRLSPDSASSSGGGSGGPGAPLAVGIGGLAGLILPGLDFIGGRRMRRGRRTP
jgi:parallel beta-helix repeat protein